ncbi:hypothetical protein CCC_01759 [Paramagnetospirillum magnetotacticum MS-1]|uniref:Uncharacterized protein n=1 Tax=Paramagnetospirillum magnetotacticum MS-1 TaxID=272627 RepID=A0A0C2YLT2_PARME|nr:DUF6134 family protein [Paramagnetospirillum magnetotacticum]KIM00765.1 hypothetical protein CCC_01759 [Paramagnetospirillum magnetotacticum MS-1]
MRTFRPLIAALVLLVAATTAAAAPPFLTNQSEQNLSFAVTRNGGYIGYHNFVFRPRKGGFEVLVEADIRVNFMLIPFFIFEQRGVEIWENGHLQSMDYTTNDDGIRHRVRAEASGGAIRVWVDDKPPASHPRMFPGSLWYPLSPSTTMMLDPGDGKPTPLKVQSLGEETIMVRGKTTHTTRWLWDDGLRRELWYDSEQALVQVWIKGDDGSDIYYVLK